jgi:hypothetical protein
MATTAARASVRSAAVAIRRSNRSLTEAAKRVKASNSSSSRLAKW